MKKMNVRMLTQISMLIALQLVLSRLCSINTDSLRIGFGFVPMAMCGLLFGPVWTAVAYGVADCIGASVFYGSINPGITLSVMVCGFFYGLFLHRENVRFFPDVVFAAAGSFLCSMLITTGALSLMYGSPFWVQLGIRMPQGIACMIAELVVIPVLVQLSRSLKKHGLVAAA
ncbi:MAG: folate family ECF transporter S component [Candidatus Heteroscillospira sp.]|jgi:ECF transporter S component (folate family)